MEIDNDKIIRKEACELPVFSSENIHRDDSGDIGNKGIFKV